MVKVKLLVCSVMSVMMGSENNQNGRSMIEMLGVLAVIGMLSVGAIGGYTIAMQSFRSNEALDLIQKTSVQIRTTFNEKYTGLNCAVLGSIGILDERYINAGGNCQNPPVGASWTITSPSQKFYTISLKGVDLAPCTKLARAYWGDSGTFVDLKVGAEGSEVLVSSAAISPPVETVVEQCKNGGSMVWTFR